MTDQPEQPARVEPTFRGWMGSMWLYTTLRFGLFGVLWGILYLLGVSGYIAAMIGLVLSVPLSFVLLARPRARFAAQLEARVDSRRFQREDLDTQLDPDAHDREAELREAQAEEARRVDMRKKSRRAATPD
ncbi:DUF4229 domain-containing protein [uncultured Jatrophihabitans sp.]|uniref:DUF4229 domain-containing protein n=1 Tax=uncultured Jatrophihabitans sp. TaxID=1610747 RepID=UPI0035CC2F0D